MPVALKEKHFFGTDMFNETAHENATMPYDDCEGRDCTYGIIPNQQMMETIAAWGPLIYAGCFAATLSSAIASLLGAPRVFQAVAKDKLFPYIDSFAQGYGANNDPVRGYILVFIISLVCIIIADLNVVSSLLSNFFVAAYALINFSVFHGSIMESPGWRPSFKYYNKWVSLFGTILCVAVMFLMDYITAMITFIIIAALYMVIYIRKPNVNWGSSSQSQSFVSALKAIHTLATVEDHAKTYRPKILCMSGNPEDRPALVDFASLFTRGVSLLEVAHIIDSTVDHREFGEKKLKTQKWLKENHIKAFYALTRNDNLSEGTRAALELSGLGKLSPNMALFGLKAFDRYNLEDAEEYVRALHEPIDFHLSIAVLKLADGLDISKQFGKHNEGVMNQIKRRQSNVHDWPELTRLQSLEVIGEEDEDNELFVTRNEKKTKEEEMEKETKKKEKKKKKKETGASFFDKITGKAAAMKKSSIVLTDQYGNVIDDDKIEHVVQFRNLHVFEGVIDVYWLFDDGGLTLLLPYILTTRDKYAKCKLRVFFLADKVDELDSATRNMAELLAKFRIDFQDVIPIPDATQKPSVHTRNAFQKMITTNNGECIIPEEDLEENNSRTNFSLRLAEIVQENSKNSQLVVMTLPLMRKGIIPPLLYLAWLDYATKNMPPFLYVRGNQEPVLTFYS